MAGIINKLDIFLSTPNDTAHFYEALKTLISESGDELLRKNLYIKLHHQSTISPRMAEEVQAAINPEIEQCDLHIAVLHGRLGTPTNRHPSGTAEEVQRTIEKRKKTPEAVELMIYFKSRHDDIMQLDAGEVQRLQDFGKHLLKQGVYYQKFREDEDFVRMMRDHLLGLADRWVDGKWNEAGIPRHPASGPNKLLELPGKHDELTREAEESDDGALDLIIVAEEEMEAATKHIESMSEAMQDIAEKYSNHTAKVEGIDVSTLDNKARKRLVNDAADDTLAFARRLESESSAFERHFIESLSSFSRVLDIQESLIGSGQSAESDSDEQILQLQLNFREMRGAIKEASNGARSFRETIEEMPRLTTRFNRANRTARDVLNVLLGNFAAHISRVDEIDSKLDGMRELDKASLTPDRNGELDATLPSIVQLDGPPVATTQITVPITTGAVPVQGE